MATIERYQTSTGTTRYMVRYRTPQHTQTKKRGFTTKRAAEAFANTVEVEKLTGSYVAPSLGQVTVASWVRNGLPARRTTRPVGRRVWNQSGGCMSNRTGVADASLIFGQPRSNSGLPK